MESPTDPIESLRALDRAAALPYTESPRSTWWWPPSAGAWASATLACVLYLQDSWAYGPAVLLLVAVELFALWAYRRKAGAMPRMLQAPPEFRHAYRRYFIGVAVVAAAIGAATLLTPPPLAILVCFLGVTIGLARFDRVYDDAAEQLRERLR